jgi:hypothetical protein
MKKKTREMRSEPLNEGSVRFKSGGSGEIYNSNEIYLTSIEKNK